MFFSFHSPLNYKEKQGSIIFNYLGYNPLNSLEIVLKSIYKISNSKYIVEREECGAIKKNRIIPREFSNNNCIFSIWRDEGFIQSR
jgi:hypothetical protein